MTDDPDDLPEDIEVEGFSESDYVEVEDAVIIAPRGWGWFADTVGAAAVRVKMPKGGSVEVLYSSDGESWRWIDVTKLTDTAEVRALKSVK